MSKIKHAGMMRIEFPEEITEEEYEKIFTSFIEKLEEAGYHPCQLNTEEWVAFIRDKFPQEIFPQLYPAIGLDEETPKNTP